MSANAVDRSPVDRPAMSRSISLGPAEIHVWLALYDEIDGEALLASYRDLLDDAERAQETRFYFAKDRRRYLITRALVRTVLSRYIAIQPRGCAFSVNAYGRPSIVNAQARDTGLSFNISHTDSMIVLGVTRGRALGVDVENYRARPAAIEVAGHYFAKEEIAELTALSQQQQQYRFFEYWTFKESYIKARGMGLSLPLDKFSFRYPHEQAVEIAIDPGLADDPGRWQFWQLQPRPEYLLAICAERVGSELPYLIVREAIPMLKEERVAAQFLRVSTSAHLHGLQPSQ